MEGAGGGRRAGQSLGEEEGLEPLGGSQRPRENGPSEYGRGEAIGWGEGEERAAEAQQQGVFSGQPLTRRWTGKAEGWRRHGKRCWRRGSAMCGLAGVPRGPGWPPSPLCRPAVQCCLRGPVTDKPPAADLPPDTRPPMRDHCLWLGFELSARCCPRAGSRPCQPPAPPTPPPPPQEPDTLLQAACG